MRRTLLTLLKIAVSLGLLGLAMRGVDLALLRTRFASMSLGWFAAAIGVSLIQTVVSAVRFVDVTEACGVPLALGRATWINLIGTFFNQVLPSSIGGDAMRLWLVARGGAGWTRATYAVLADRIVGLIALALMVAVSLPWSLALVASSTGQFALIAIAAGGLTASFVFLIIGALNVTWLATWWPTRHIKACADIVLSLLRHPRDASQIIIVSVVIHLLAVLIAWCAARAVAADVAMTDLLLLIPPVMLLTMIPVSIAGWGLREGAMVAAFGYAGLPIADGLMVSLVFGIAVFVAGAAGGIAWVFDQGASEPQRSTDNGEPR